MDEQKAVVDMGGTMRLGAYPAKLLAGSVVREIYGEEVVYERHRHRYELNNRYRQVFEEHGMVLSGTSPDDLLVEFIELPKQTHPFFVATQAHPEFKSRPNRPHPLFAAFVSAALERADGRLPRLPSPRRRPRSGREPVVAGRRPHGRRAGEAARRARRLARRRTGAGRRTRWPPTGATSGATPRSCAPATRPTRRGSAKTSCTPTSAISRRSSDDDGRRQLAASSVAAGRRRGAVVPPVLRAEGFVERDPSEEVGAPRVPAGIPKALDEDEVDRLLHAVTGDEPLAQRDRALLELLYGTGIRISEAVGLDLDDLDLDDGTIRVLGKGSKERVVPVGRGAASRSRRTCATAGSRCAGRGPGAPCATATRWC